MSEIYLWAVSLYERAIEDGSHYDAMFEFSTILREGTEGIEQDVVRAVSLYERAIDEGSDYNAMHGLATLSRDGNQ